eukprot:Clim_evm44s119 gene=Clim_evmTU44s119
MTNPRAWSKYIYRNLHKRMRKFGNNKKDKRIVIRQHLSHLILHERLVTTWTNVKRIEPYAEKLLYNAERVVNLKETSAHKVVTAYLMKEYWTIPKLYKYLIPRYQDLPRSDIPTEKQNDTHWKYAPRTRYTQTFRLPERKSDRARMGVIELVGHPFPPITYGREEQERLFKEFIENKPRFRFPDKGDRLRRLMHYEPYNNEEERLYRLLPGRDAEPMRLDGAAAGTVVDRSEGEVRQAPSTSNQADHTS